MENDCIHYFVGECVFLLQQHADENVCRAAGFEVVGHLLSGDFAKTVDGCCRVQDRDTDAHEHGTDDVCFSERASARCEQREQQTLEETGGLVESLFQRFVEVDV